MSDPVDEHLNKAFACLDDVPARELYATARALERRRDALASSPASSVTSLTRAGKAGGADIPRFHLRENVSRANDKLAAQIADAPAPFWSHIRDALADRHS